VELERLNTTTDEINRWETELDVNPDLTVILLPGSDLDISVYLM
jgi:hypothetical protein